MVKKLGIVAASAALAGCVVMVPMAPNPSAPPTFGSVTLQAGFVHTVSVQSGGSIDAVVVGSNCRGYVATAPDFVVDFRTFAGILPLLVSVNSGSDTTLVVSDPNGNWFCDDDSGPGLNPRLQINAPVNGRYAIWVGTYGGAGVFQPATLRIN
jgi:hypothetical protein